MTDPKVSATKGSTAVGGDVNAPLLNLNLTAPNAAEVNLTIEQHVSRELPSFLGTLIAAFSKQALSEYGRGSKRELPAEVIEKVNYNHLSLDHRALVDYYRHSLELERAYLGVEQQNADARYLVRRKAAIAYSAEIREALKITPTARAIDIVRESANRLVENVINRLLDDYKTSSGIKVEQEIAHLAVSLVVVDAVVECEVLERPVNAVTT
jgi:hypothetical protein